MASRGQGNSVMLTFPAAEATDFNGKGAINLNWQLFAGSIHRLQYMYSWLLDCRELVCWR